MCYHPRMNEKSDESPEVKETPEQWLARKFPGVKRTASAPTLTLINGFGTRFSGTRDFDAETGSHVTTRVISLLFVPVLALDAWRIIPGGGGRYHLIGKAPLSPFARRANWVVAALSAVCAAGLGWNSYTSSPDYRGRKMMETAQAEMASGRPGAAMRSYFAVLDSGFPQAAAARQGYSDAFDAALRTGSGRDRVDAVQHGRGAALSSNKVLPDEAARVLAWSNEEKDPAMALQVMKAALPAVPQTEHEAYEKRRRALLEQVTAAQPGNLDAAVDLAFILDEEDKGEEAKKLLVPHRAALGDGEGSRILGQLLVREGDFKGGAELLRAYAPAKLKAYHDAESKLDKLYTTISDQAVSQLDQGNGPREFYNAYKQGDEKAKQQLVNDYVAEKMSKSAALTQAQATLADVSRIVPVMLDLGIATLRVAQATEDAAQRKKGLEEAEQAFVSIQGAAGDSAQYRLFLGQVYYWLGKQKEGKALFDILLGEASETQVHLMVVESLRQVGEKTEARKIAEAAYAKAKTSEDRTAAASSRALLWEDAEDRIRWLTRREDKSEIREIELADARAGKLIGEGKSAEAVPLLRQVIDGYAKLPRSASSLNNSANALSTLYGITHDPADASESLNRYEEASRLEPDDTVLLSNLASGYQGRIWIGMAADLADLRTLPPGIESVIASAAVQNEADVAAQRTRISESEACRKAIETLERLIVLAPRDSSHFSQLQGLRSICRQTGELKKLLERVKAQDLDHTREWEMVRKAVGEDKTADSLRGIDAALKEAEKALAALPKDARPEVKAALHTLIFGQKTLRTEHAPGLTSEELASGAEALLKLSGSQGARGVAQGALLQAALLDAKKDPAFAAFADKYQKWLSNYSLLGFALDRKLGGERLRSSPWLKRFLEVSSATSELFPDAAGLQEWAILRHLDPARAEVLGRAILADERRLVDLELDAHLSPWSTGTVCTRYWLDLLQGKDPHSSALWQNAVKQGLPIKDLQ